MSVYQLCSAVVECLLSESDSTNNKNGLETGLVSETGLKSSSTVEIVEISE